MLQFVFKITNKIFSIRNSFFTPRIKVLPNKLSFITLGSEYGKKTICTDYLPENSNIISAGIGEDISFDVEIANLTNGLIIMIDPTPRAINHFENFIESFNNDRKTMYSNNGKQDIESYDTSGLSSDRFKLYPKALWKNENDIFFYAPLNEDHVSHSAIDIQKTKNKKKAIHVKSVTLKKVMDDYSIEKLDLLKLDIEGAQLEVLNSAFKNKIFPTQIILEIDELNFPSLKSFIRARRMLRLMKKNDYLLISKSDGFDLTYVHNLNT